MQGTALSTLQIDLFILHCPSSQSESFDNTHMFGLITSVLCFGFIFHSYFSLILLHQQKKSLYFKVTML